MEGVQTLVCMPAMQQNHDVARHRRCRPTGQHAQPAPNRRACRARSTKLKRPNASPWRHRPPGPPPAAPAPHVRSCSEPPQQTLQVVGLHVHRATGRSTRALGSETHFARASQWCVYAWRGLL
eukprot:362932-Chlamydomonas_euryale.AAC.9